jgi:hypothetical protein
MDVNFSFDQACEFIYCKKRDKPNYKDGVSLCTALNKAARRLAVADPATCQEVRRVVKAGSISLGLLAKIVRGGLLPGGYQRLLLPDHYEKALSELTAGSDELSVVHVAPLVVSTDDELRQVLVSPFDSIRHSDDTQSDPELQEYWLARELQSLLGYETWQRFEEAIHRAAESLDTYGLSRGYHFSAAAKMIPTGKDAMREVTDYRLSRHACHLIAQNGDPTKPEIAAAQAYFSIQTRRAELMDAGLTSIQRTAEIDRLIAGMESLTNNSETVVEEIDHLKQLLLAIVHRIDNLKSNDGRAKERFTRPVRTKAAKYLYAFTSLHFPNTPGCDLIDRTIIVKADGTWVNCEFDHWDTTTICNEVINCVPMSVKTHRRKHSKNAAELTEDGKELINEFIRFVKRRESQDKDTNHQIALPI